MSLSFKTALLSFLLILVLVSYSAGKPVVALIKSKNIAPYNMAGEAFKDRMKGKANIIEYVLDDFHDKKLLYQKIRAFKPDLIFVVGASALKILFSEFTETPIIFSVVLNPVKLKLIDSWTEPGRNLTGIALNISYEIQFSWIKKILPAATRVGIIYKIGWDVQSLEKAAKAAERSGLKLVSQKIDGTKDLLPALKNLSRHSDILLGIPDLGVYNRKTLKQILLFTLRNRIPFMAISEQHVKAGAFFCLSVDYKEQGECAAEMAKTIFKGFDPAAIPVKRPDNLKLAINLKTAKRLGIKINTEFLENAVLY